jgi:hypothetical protein
MTTRKLGALLAAAAGLVLMFAIPAGATAKDRNHDRISDRWERHHHLSLNVKQGRRDQDRDGLRNMGEFKAHDNPRDADTDNDGVGDGDENAGTIASLDAGSGRLVINLFGGDTLSGLVTPATEIKCENEHEFGDDDLRDRHGGEGSEDNSGPGSENEGPGRGDDEDRNCSSADLTPGRTVEEAELHTEGGAAVFEEVELR